MMKRVILSCNHEPRKRGGAAKKLGKSKEQICVVIAHDNGRGVLSQMEGKGRINIQEMDGLLGHYIDTSVLLCTDSTTNYKNFAKMKGIQHEAINVRQGK